MNACEYDEPVSCETCQDSGWADARVGEDIKALIECPDCGGMTPAFLVGHDDLPSWFQDGARR